MRSSACAADGLGAMRGSREFLATIGSRETALGKRLFDPGAVSAVTAPLGPDDVLGQLP